MIASQCTVQRTWPLRLGYFGDAVVHKRSFKQDARRTVGEAKEARVDASTGGTGERIGVVVHRPSGILKLQDAHRFVGAVKIGIGCDLTQVAGRRKELARREVGEHGLESRKACQGRDGARNGNEDSR